MVGGPFHWHFLPVPTWEVPYNEIKAANASPSTSFESDLTTSFLELTSPVFTSMFDFDSSLVDFPPSFELSSEFDSLLGMPPAVSSEEAVYLLSDSQQGLLPRWTYSPGLKLLLEAVQSSSSYISTDNSYF